MRKSNIETMADGGGGGAVGSAGSTFSTSESGQEKAAAISEVPGISLVDFCVQLDDCTPTVLFVYNFV